MEESNLQILVSFPEGMEGDANPEKVKKELENEFNEITNDIKFTESNIGLGADWPVIVFLLGSLFFLGKKINENLEAWIELAKKFKKLIKRLGKRVYFIDSNGSTLLALHKIIDEEQQIKSIVEVHSIELSNSPIKKAFFDDRPENRIDSKPYRYFIKVFLVNGNLFHIFEIKSDGTIKNYRKFSDEHTDYFNY